MWDIIKYLRNKIWHGQNVLSPLFFVVAAILALLQLSVGSLVHEIFTDLPGGKWGFIFVSQLLIFVLGFFLDFVEICFIVVPLLAPIASFLGLDLLWFALLISVNLQTSFLTPPFGFSLFYLKAVAPSSVRIQQIYRGVLPFIFIQLVVIAIIATQPELARWLPDLVDQMIGIKSRP